MPLKQENRHWSVYWCKRCNSTHRHHVDECPRQDWTWCKLCKYYFKNEKLHQIYIESHDQHYYTDLEMEPHKLKLKVKV